MGYSNYLIQDGYKMVDKLITTKLLFGSFRHLVCHRFYMICHRFYLFFLYEERTRETAGMIMCGFVSSCSSPKTRARHQIISISGRTATFKPQQGYTCRWKSREDKSKRILRGVSVDELWVQGNAVPPQGACPSDHWEFHFPRVAMNWWLYLLLCRW